MKLKILFVVVIILIAVLAFILFYHKNTVSLNLKTIDQTDDFFNVQVEYPQFEGVSQDFNKSISDLVSERIDMFKTDSRDNYQARLDTEFLGQNLPATPTAPFDFVCQWESVQMSDSYLSFVLNIYYFTGGAHGATEVYAFNYDIKNQKTISMSDFLGGNQDSLNKLSELAIKDISKQFNNSGAQVDDFIQQEINQGAAPTWDNYKDFNFDNNKLVIYFQRYQVGPGAFGSVTVEIDKQTLEQNSIESAYMNNKEDFWSKLK